MLLNESQILSLQHHWPFEGPIAFHRRVANFVYFTRLQGEAVVLRLTEPGHRSAREIESELDWIRHLSVNGMAAAGPILSSRGTFVAEIHGEQNFFAVVFNMAPGGFLKDEGELAPTMIKRWGEYVGRMHRLTRMYKPSLQILPRQHWRQDESLAMALRSHDPKDPIPYRRLHELLEWMSCLPQTEECYGLIHGDLHRGNFFVQDDQMTAFDFDDSCHHWFSYDLIAPLNSVHENFFEGQSHPQKERALAILLEGYMREHPIAPLWIERIELFDRFRAALVYHWIKTCVKEGIFDAKGLAWASQKVPKLQRVVEEPLHLF